MRRRHIALQPGPQRWAYAVVCKDRTETTLHATGFFTPDPERKLTDQLGEIIGPVQLTDRLACELPGRHALLRWLQFPFSDPRKIAAAAGPELARQLPGGLDDRVIYQQNLGDGKLLATAVTKQAIEELLDLFDNNQAPISYLGLSPLCFIPALSWPVDCLFLCVNDVEISIGRIENSHLVDVRILPQGATEIPLTQLVLQIQTLAHGSTQALSLVRTLGIDSNDPLFKGLQTSGFDVEPITLLCNNSTVEPELTRVSCLALGAAKSQPSDLNLRSGPYKLKNDWQALKWRGGIAGALLAVSLLLFVGNGYLQYHLRETQLHRLQQQLTNLYHRQFPGEKLQVAAPLQLQSKLKALQKKNRQFGADSPRALQVLLVISQRIPADISLDIREYLYNDAGLRLSGSTTSFDAVSQLLSNLQQEPLFKGVRVLDSKQALDGDRVDFQLQIQLDKGGDQ